MIAIGRSTSRQPLDRHVSFRFVQNFLPKDFIPAVESKLGPRKSQETVPLGRRHGLLTQSQSPAFTRETQGIDRFRILASPELARYTMPTMNRLFCILIPLLAMTASLHAQLIVAHRGASRQGGPLLHHFIRSRVEDALVLAT